jgi:hypothetical protein
MRVATSTIDPVFDPVTHEYCYADNEDDVAVDVSRGGLRLRCARPPAVGTRIVLHVRDDGSGNAFDVVGRARWTRVEFEPGVQGARAIAAVGIEVVGGSRNALDRFEKCVSKHQQDLVAEAEGLG